MQHPHILWPHHNIIYSILELETSIINKHKYSNHATSIIKTFSSDLFHENICKLKNCVSAPTDHHLIICLPIPNQLSNIQFKIFLLLLWRARISQMWNIRSIRTADKRVLYFQMEWNLFQSYIMDIRNIKHSTVDLWTCTIYLDLDGAISLK